VQLRPAARKMARSPFGCCSVLPLISVAALVWLSGKLEKRY
jgi:hypothetical protein